jgi:hypothetical protein
VATNTSDPDSWVNIDSDGAAGWANFWAAETSSQCSSGDCVLLQTWIYDLTFSLDTLDATYNIFYGDFTSVQVWFSCGFTALTGSCDDAGEFYDGEFFFYDGSFTP